MRNPNKRIHAVLSIVRGQPSRSLADENLHAPSECGVVNHNRQEYFHSVTGVPALCMDEPAALASGASAIRGIGAHDLIAAQFDAVQDGGGHTILPEVGGKLIAVGDFEGVAVSTALSGDSALQLAQLQVQELAAANRRKDEFLALLAHELRSPLCAIGYAVDLLRTHTKGGGPQQPLQVLIERQLRHMSELVDEMLDVSRINHGLLNLQSKPVDLRVVVRNAIQTLQCDTNARSQLVTVRMPEVPVWVMGDERRLEQVFVNLVANASRYTDKGGELTTWMHSETEEAVVGIRDSGIGIEPDSLSHIFELFRQAHPGDPRSQAGLGIGLALVRQLVELHGGRVTAASEGIGRGSEFTVRLPLHTDWSSTMVPVGEGSEI